jgi:2-keto-4-pentenoate hydratase
VIDAATRSALADDYLAAYDACTLLAELPSHRIPGFDLDAAFVVADLLRTRRLARGERQVGWKIGFTNRGIWDRYGVHAPIWGPVYDTTTTLLDGTTVDVSLAGLSQPRLEPEIVLHLATVPRAGMTTAELAGCIDWVAHGFEIVHTHCAAWRFSAADCQADFALHGRLLVGPRVPIGAFADPAADLAALHVELFDGDRCVDSGDATIVLDGPLNALRLWVDAMARQQPRWEIGAGDLVTTGTITDAYPLAPGMNCRSVLSDTRLPGLRLHAIG